MTVYVCADACGWSYNTDTAGPDEMPPYTTQTLPNGVNILRSNLITKIYCPACNYRTMSPRFFQDVPEVVVV